MDGSIIWSGGDNGGGGDGLAVEKQEKIKERWTMLIWIFPYVEYNSKRWKQEGEKFSGWLFTFFLSF